MVSIKQPITMPIYIWQRAPIQDSADSVPDVIVSILKHVIDLPFPPYTEDAVLCCYRVATDCKFMTDKQKAQLNTENN